MIPLPMTPETFIAEVLEPALKLLRPGLDSPAARVMVTAICLQESGLAHRRQLVGSPPRPVGPAKGLAQFELGGGCAGVLRHTASRDMMRFVCEARECEPIPRALWDALEVDDILAAAAARLLLFTDPKRLPAVGDEAGAWEIYIRVWKPGKPHPKTWSKFYRTAVRAAQ